MAKFEQGKMPPRVLICGESASGKTGAIAQLANAGYRILLFDFDQNSRVIGSYLKEGHADIFVKTLNAARLTNAGVLGGAKESQQTAVKQMNEFYKMLQHWKTPEEDLGPSKDLSPKDVIVIDSGTFLAELCLMAAYEHPDANKHTPTIYRIAGQFYASILDYLTGSNVGASVVVLTHIMQTGDKDDQGRIVGKARDIPVGVGEKMSKRMSQYFSDIWKLEVGRSGERTFQTGATDKMSLRTSAPHKIKATEPFDLASMFNRLLET
jgi:hypothetical protein